MQWDDLKQRISDYMAATWECPHESICVLSHGATVKVKKEHVPSAFNFLVLLKTGFTCEKAVHTNVLPAHDGSNLDKWWGTAVQGISKCRTRRNHNKRKSKRARAHTHTHTHTHTHKHKRAHAHIHTCIHETKKQDYGA